MCLFNFIKKEQNEFVVQLQNKIQKVQTQRWIDASE